MKKLAITLLLAIVLIAVPGCPRNWAHAAVAGAAVGLVAADAIHHTRHHDSHYSRDRDVRVHYNSPSYHHRTTYYPGYHTTYYPPPRVVYHAPRPVRVVRHRPRPPVYFDVRFGY